MQNPTFWARLGLLWCLFIFAACWCASAKAAASNFAGTPAADSVAALAAPPNIVTTTIAVANSQTNATQVVAANGVVAHAIPTLDGFGLFVLAVLLGLAVLWFRHRRE
jgi:hypothetical protein